MSKHLNINVKIENNFRLKVNIIPKMIKIKLMLLMIIIMSKLRTIPLIEYIFTSIPKAKK